MSYKAKADAIRTQDEGAYRGGRVNPDVPPPAPPRTVQRDGSEGARTMERIRRVREMMPHIPERFVWAFALEIKDREEPHRVTPGARAVYRKVIENCCRGASQSAVPADEPLPWQ